MTALRLVLALPLALPLALVSACSVAADEGAGFDGSAQTGDAEATAATEPSGPGGDPSTADEAISDGTRPIFDVAGPDTSGEGGGDGLPQTCAEAMQAGSNQGCEFWAVDLPNAWRAYPEALGSFAQEQQFAVVVANTSIDQHAAVEITLGATGAPIDAASIAPGELHTFALPAQDIYPMATSITAGAYRIESDVPVTAYQFQPLDNTTEVYSNDASLLFPTHTFATDYTAVTGEANLVTLAAGATENAGAFVSVVATEDGTVVDVYPTASLYPGAVQDVVLDRGQVLTAISTGAMTLPSPVGDGELSGTRVHADKPVAVFSGNVTARVPATQADICCADHLEHQMLPLQAWGSAYIAAPAAHPAGGGADVEAVYRITGAFDDTALHYDPAPPPGAPSSLDAGETVAFQTKQAFVVTSDDAAHPFAVTEFLVSAMVIHLANTQGDPAMIALPAATQFQRGYVFMVPGAYVSNFATIVFPAGEAVELDGAALDTTAAKLLGKLDDVDYRYLHVPVDEGPHVLSGDAPLGIVVTGYAEAVSYGYPGGAGLAAISEPPPVPAG